MSEILTCIASFEAKAGAEEELKQALLDVVPLALAEPGCLSYQLHQAIGKPGLLTLIEQFQDRAAYTLHTQQPYLKALKLKLPSLTEAQVVNTYSACG